MLAWSDSKSIIQISNFIVIPQDYFYLNLIVIYETIIYSFVSDFVFVASFKGYLE